MVEPQSNPSSDQALVNCRLHEKDCGSAQAQIAILTQRIEGLAGHFKAHRKDRHSHRGLLLMVSRRRRLLKYLRRSDMPSYKKVIQTLGLRR